MKAPAVRSVRGFTLIEMLLVIAVLTALMGLLLPSVQNARAASMRTQCSSQLKQFGLAIATAHETMGGLLPSRLENPATGTNTGEATWALLIMPYIDLNPMYRRWDLTKTYNNQTNFPHASAVNSLYYCPARRGVNVLSKTGGGQLDNFAGCLSDYAVAGGDDGAVPGPWYTKDSRGALISADCSGGLDRFRPRTKISSITDGLSNTILLGEKHVRPTRFGESDEDNSVLNGASPYSHIRVAGPGYELARGIADTANASSVFGSWHGDMVFFLMGDGSVRTIQKSASGTLLSYLARRDDGQVLPEE